MKEVAVRREHVVRVLREALEPRDFVGAMWEAGAAAIGRVDEWSDMDLLVLVEDAHVEEVFDVAAAALERLSPIELSFRFPEPAWHGHSQTFYRLRDASEFLLVDFVVMKRGGTSDRFLQPEIHGTPVVYFDKWGEVMWEPLEPAALAEKLRGRRETMTSLFRLFLPFVEKELKRGNDVEALSYYHSVVLRPLVELLRIKHTPLRHNFFARYVYYELPRDVVERLERLFFVARAGELRGKCQEAARWFSELLNDLGDGPVESDISDAVARERGGFGRE